MQIVTVLHCRGCTSFTSIGEAAGVESYDTVLEPVLHKIGKMICCVRVTIIGVFIAQSECRSSSSLVNDDRASQFQSACQCQQIETLAGPNFGPPPARDCLPRQLSAIGSQWQERERDSNGTMVNRTSISFHLNRCISTARDPRRCRRPCKRRGLGNEGGGLGKELEKRGSGQRMKKWAKQTLCWQRSDFAWQRKFNYDGLPVIIALHDA